VEGETSELVRIDGRSKKRWFLCIKIFRGLFGKHSCFGYEYFLQRQCFLLEKKILAGRKPAENRVLSTPPGQLAAVSIGGMVNGDGYTPHHTWAWNLARQARSRTSGDCSNTSSCASLTLGARAPFVLAGKSVKARKHFH